MDIATLRACTEKLTDNVKNVIKGKDDIIQKVIVAILCDGHILLEDIPGTGKTTLAKALARSIDCSFRRTQFTPDLLPSDLTGINFFDQKESEFVFKPGPVFTNILLGDEINRATPRTQSSLLECMEERQVTVDGQTYKLEKPFLVLATQNPIETQGTFPLPEAQLDRFFMRLAMGYPDKEFEVSMMSSQQTTHPVESLERVLSREELIEAQALVRQVSLSDAVKRYIVDIVNGTRNHPRIRLGVSPRGTLAFMRGAQAYAAINGRDYVMPDDVKAVALDVLSHRILCKGTSLSTGHALSHEILSQIVDETRVPIE